MKPAKSLKLILIVALIALTGAAMALTVGSQPGGSGISQSTSASHTGGPGAILTMDAHLVQDKVLSGGPGQFGLVLDLEAAQLEPDHQSSRAGVDMVVVIDRSGSMQGQKLADARRALLALLERMSPRDRLALVAYSDRAWRLCGLTFLDAQGRGRLEDAIERVAAGGGTNLGAGLGEGIQTLLAADQGLKSRKLLLISDGLANQGITDPHALGSMASAALENAFTIGTLGVGLDFNESLMTRIADHGGGTYHFLENPYAFAAVFEKEWQLIRQVAASGVTIRIPLKNGLRVVDAGGYPVRVENGEAIIHPGDLAAGRSRKLHLTLALPTDNVRRYAIQGIRLGYRHQGRLFHATAKETLWVACEADQREVLSSIKAAPWAGKVIEGEYGRLKEEVAADIREGKKDRALQRIEAFDDQNRSINASVGSKAVEQMLDTDLGELRSTVQETFRGAPEAVKAKQKSNAKALQYDGYKVRRQLK